MINKLLVDYRHLIDFNDKMQRSNLKFVESYISFQKRKNILNWETDCVEFLKGAIDIQNKLLYDIKLYKINFKGV